MTLRTRWLGRVPYREALALQQGLFDHGTENHLLLVEHPHVFTYGASADLSTNVLVDPASVGAELVKVSRGGDVTYHGPGQLVGYPILSLAPKHGRGATGMADSVAYVTAVEQLIIDALGELGVSGAGRLPGYAGVWLDPATDRERKVCAIGVRLSRGRTMHGFALNNTTDLTYMRRYIIPCGIADKPVTSLAEEGVAVEMRRVVEVVERLAAERWGSGDAEHQSVVWRESTDDLSPFSRGAGPGATVRSAADHGVTEEPALADEATSVTLSIGRKPVVPDAVGGSARVRARLADAGVAPGMAVTARKPEWLRPRVHHGTEVIRLKKTLRELQLVTVCEEAGCPNLSECWSDGTATFMVLGERCTRACGFCLVDTRKPAAPDADEPDRVAEAVERMQLGHAVLTMVARDDLADGGIAHVAECVAAIHGRRPGTSVEVLVSDGKGDHASFAPLFGAGAARPEVFNHNLETVARLQRAVRPSAGYARSLGLLAAAKAAGLTTKSGLIVGMGETDEEIVGALADLAGIGVSIVTIGQYLRPTSHHLPVARWVEPATFDRYRKEGERLGIAHVESSPLTRSSYHAKRSAQTVLA